MSAAAQDQKINEENFFLQQVYLLHNMNRAPREKLFSTVSTLTTKLQERRKARKKLEKQKKKEEWEKYVQTIGLTPLTFGSDELDQAVVYVEDMILKAVADGWESCRITFDAKHDFAYPFFPSKARLGEGEFGKRFRSEAMINLFNALRIRNPDLDIVNKSNSHSMRFHF